MAHSEDSVLDRLEIPLGSTRLSTLVAGPEDGEEVLLLHGIPASARLWQGVMPRLVAAGYRVWAPDLPGYGETSLPEDGDHSLVGAATLLAHWIRDGDSPGPRAPVWLVGHDLGGAVAQILVTRHPGTVQRLTLGDTVAEDSWPVLPIRLFRIVARLGLYPAMAAVGLVPNPWAWHQLRRGFSDPSRCTPELATDVFWDRKVIDAEGRRAFARHLKALDPKQTVAIAPLLADVDVPTLLLWGADDVFQDASTVGQRLRELLPDPDFQAVASAGHFFPLERPAVYSEALVRWRRDRAPPADVSAAG